MSDNLLAIEDIRGSRLIALDMLPPKYRVKFTEMDPLVADMTEMGLEERFTRTPNDYALRKRLWELVDECQLTGQKISTEAWVRGIVESPYMHQTLINNPFRLAWLLTPLTHHSARYEELFHLVFSKLRKRMSEMEVNDANFASTVKFLENLSNRVMGPVPRNINLKTQSLPPPEPVRTNNADMDKRLKELEDMKNAIPIIDVDPG